MPEGRVRHSSPPHNIVSYRPLPRRARAVDARVRVELFDGGEELLLRDGLVKVAVHGVEADLRRRLLLRCRFLGHILLVRPSRLVAEKIFRKYNLSIKKRRIHKIYSFKRNVSQV